MMCFRLFPILGAFAAAFILTSSLSMDHKLQLPIGTTFQRRICILLYGVASMIRFDALLVLWLVTALACVDMLWCGRQLVQDIENQ